MKKESESFSSSKQATEFDRVKKKAESSPIIEIYLTPLSEFQTSYIASMAFSHSFLD